MRRAGRVKTGLSPSRTQDQSADKSQMILDNRQLDLLEETPALADKTQESSTDG